MLTPRTKLRRKPKRGSHERELIEAIFDRSLVSHLGVIDDGLPLVVPMLHARVGSEVFLHGSAASRALRGSHGAQICLTATLLDGVVLARAAMHHSVNYRSAMLFGEARAVEDEAEKLTALEAVVEKVVPGRWADARRPTSKELRGTAVLRVPLEEASAKVREGGPLDDEDDMELAVWAGVVPMRSVADAPLADPLLAAGIEPPAYLEDLLIPGEGERRKGSNQSP